MQLNEKGVKIIWKEKTTQTIEIATPDYFIKELNKNKKAFEVFEAFAPSHRKEYNSWIIYAKPEIARKKRMSQA